MKKEELIKFYQNYKLFIFPAVVALSSLFLIIFAIIPQTIKLLDNQKAAEQLSVKSKFLESKVSALESYNEEDLSQKLGFALKAFPADKDYISILGLLQQVTAKSGFSITSVALGEGAAGKSEKGNSYMVKLQVKGARILFETLLDNLENSPRLIKVNSIELSSNQTAQSIDVSLGVEVLYSRMPQNAGTLDTPLPQMSQKDEELLAALADRSYEAGSSSIVSQPQGPTSSRGKANPFE